MCRCVGVQVCGCAHVCMYTCACVHVYVCMCACTCIIVAECVNNACVHVHVYMHVYYYDCVNNACIRDCIYGYIHVFIICLLCISSYVQIHPNNCKLLQYLHLNIYAWDIRTFHGKRFNLSTNLLYKKNNLLSTVK